MATLPSLGYAVGLQARPDQSYRNQWNIEQARDMAEKKQAAKEKQESDKELAGLASKMSIKNTHIIDMPEASKDFLDTHTAMTEAWKKGEWEKAYRASDEFYTRQQERTTRNVIYTGQAKIFNDNKKDLTEAQTKWHLSLETGDKEGVNFWGNKMVAEGTGEMKNNLVVSMPISSINLKTMDEKTMRESKSLFQNTLQKEQYKIDGKTTAMLIESTFDSKAEAEKYKRELGLVGEIPSLEGIAQNIINDEQYAQKYAWMNQKRIKQLYPEFDVNLNKVAEEDIDKYETQKQQLVDMKWTELRQKQSSKQVKITGRSGDMNISYSDGGANYGDVGVGMNKSAAVYVNSDVVQRVLKDKDFQEKYKRAVKVGETKTAEQYAVEAARGKDNHTFIYVEKKDAPEKELSFVIDKNTKMYLNNQGISLDENMIKGTLVGLENTPDGLKAIVKYQYGDKKMIREYTRFGEHTDSQGRKYDDVYENPKYVQVAVPFEKTSNETKIRIHYTDKKTGKGISDFLRENKKILDEEFKEKPTELSGKNQGNVSKSDRKAKAEKNLEGF